jgi:integrase
MGFHRFCESSVEREIFSPVAGKNMPKIGKVLADIRDQLGIPYLDDYGQRRLVHSFRHTMISTCLAGWVGNLAHLQQVVGHEKSGSGITRRYLHTFRYLGLLCDRRIMLVLIFLLQDQSAKLVG